MILISHRGNLSGPNIEMENHPEYIEAAITSSYNCEVDLWVINNELFFGHDCPQYKITMDFLINFKKSLWIHCKNLQSLELLINKQLGFTFFWHQNDDFTLTSNGFIWTFPGKSTCEKSILVHLSEPENMINGFNKKIAGICSDYVTKFSLLKP
jgi:hypothetical protein